MWDVLAIHHTSECKRNCPFCYLKNTQGPDKPLSYFQSVLKSARNIPHWIFSCNQTGSVKFNELVKLIQTACKYQHPYSITTNYENLAYEELPIFHMAQSVTVSLDEYKVNEHELSAFVEALANARKKGLKVNVAVTLTERMIYKTMYGSLLDLLLTLAEKVYFIYPKTMDKEWIAKSLFQVFVRQVGEKMKKRGMFSKIHIDNCLLPILSPFKSLVNDDCAYAKTLTVMSDGSVKKCPYDRKSIPIRKLKEFKDIVNEKIPAFSLDMNICPWRAKLTQREGAACYAA
jgi:MoaA/NifB/PqqE/SkfB family radical SAM enzyme